MTRRFVAILDPPLMSKGQRLKVPLTAPVKEALDRFADARGMSHGAVLSRLAEWFAKEDPSLQYLVLGLCPPDCTAKFAAQLLRRRRKAGEQ